MKKHRRTWSDSDKMEILEYCNRNGVTKATREFDVAQSIIYRWKAKYDKDGEMGLSGVIKADTYELKRLRRENDELKKIVAEKELRLRIQAEMLKKNR